MAVGGSCKGVSPRREDEPGAKSESRTDKSVVVSDQSPPILAEMEQDKFADTN